MARLLDVARAAGVSRSTVSNVFNDPERVRPAVRERVEAAAEALGYSGPDPKGRLLRAGKVNAIGVVPPGAYGVTVVFQSIYMRDFLRGIAEVCDEHGASLTLISGVDDDKARGVRDALVDGIILSRIEDVELIEPVKRRRLPFVVMEVEGDPDVSSVRVDDRGGAKLAAKHLVDLGHRRFAAISVIRDGRPGPVFHGPHEIDHALRTGLPLDRDRLSGYSEALAEAGISLSDVPIVEARSEGDGLAQGAAMLLDRASAATAVLAMDDSVALALLDEARRRKIAIPRDLSVVGFDDSHEAAHADPPLTTVVQPTVEKGRAAARILFDDGPPRHEVLPVELVVRSSTAPPRKGAERGPSLRRL